MGRCWLADIETQGWCAFDRREAQPSLREIGAVLRIREFTQRRLTTQRAIDARPNTLSSEYGLGEFPLHTDVCLNDVPPRYLILFCPRPRASATTVWDTHALEREIRDRAQFIVNDPRKKRYANFTSYKVGTSLTRYHPSLFIPFNNTAAKLVHCINTASSVIDIDWHLSSGAIIDNWRMLHGRRRAPKDNGRALWRFWGWTIK